MNKSREKLSSENVPVLNIPLPGLDHGLKTTKAVILRKGDLCPRCKGEKLDYDGLLNLSCPVCGYAQVGVCT